MNKEQMNNLGPSLREQVSQSFRRHQKAHDPMLCTPGPTNSATYIPTSNSQHNDSNILSRQPPPHNNNVNTSQLTHTSHNSNTLTRQQLCAYQRLSQLSQRLKNIHHFYKLRIQQQKQKSSYRNQIFMSIVEQLQRNHNQRMMVIKNEIHCVQEGKHEVGQVDERMSEIKLSINELLTQSTSYKSSNQQLQTQITLKQQSIRQKQKHLQKVINQEKEFRNQLEHFMKMNIKQIKRQREMLEMIDNVAVDVSGVR